MKIILALALSVVSAIADASVVTYSFSGEFRAPYRLNFGEPSPEPLFKDLIKEGDRFSGRFTFDTAAPANSYGPDPYRWAIYSGMAFELTASGFNGAVPAWSRGGVQVTDNMAASGWRPYDELIVSSGVRIDNEHTMEAILFLSPENADAFNDFRVPYGYNKFRSAHLLVYMYHWEGRMRDSVGGGVQIVLEEATAVPEPATGLLLLAGLGGIAALRRRA